jgi:hypothetical protein
MDHAETDPFRLRTWGLGVRVPPGAPTGSRNYEHSPAAVRFPGLRLGSTLLVGCLALTPLATFAGQTDSAAGPVQTYQYRPSEIPEDQRPPSTRSLVIPIAAGAAIDLASTEWGLSRCQTCSEQNAILGDSTGQRVAVKMVMAAGYYYLAREAGKHHPKTAKRLALGYLAGCAGFAAWNVHQATR